MDTHETYLVRVWLPDRPGALGAVASRFGALKGDVIGLEIIERGGGLAIDELVVSLPADITPELIAKEVGAEDDVEIEDIRRLNSATYDPQLDILEAASIVLGAENRDELASALVEHVCRAVLLSWACVVERDGGVLASWGDRPNDRWLTSFIAGSPAVAKGTEPAERATSMDTVWVPLPAASAALVVGRDSVVRAKERQRLAALARIADAWFRRVRERSDANAWASHPSRS
ncbi:MAG: hypothetical protein ACRBK7_11565 [Acidimicrobiales bacterium]